MKKAFVFVLVTCLVMGCKKDNPITTNQSPVLTGHVYLYDDVGNAVGNMSGIKVTILQSQQTSYTDSLGNYVFDNIPAGTYNFKFEYQNYPPLFIQNYKVAYDNDKAVVDNPEFFASSTGGPPQDVFGIAPTASVTSKIDSVWLGNIPYYDLSTGKIVDSSGYTFIFSTTNFKPRGHDCCVLLMGKTYNQVDYTLNKYLLIDCWMQIPALNASADGSDFQYTLNTLHNSGFAKGDSLYIRIYSVSSFSYYFDATNTNRVFPSIGAGSNIVSMVVQ